MADFDDFSDAALRLPFGESLQHRAGRGEFRRRPGRHDGVRRSRPKAPTISARTRRAMARSNDDADKAIIGELVEHARAVAAVEGSAIVVEVAGASESTYLHIQRGLHWFGIRLSWHHPVYRCSHDYGQVLVGSALSATQVQRVTSIVRDEVRRGGLIVADPMQVRCEIRRAELRTVDGMMTEHGDERWIWDSAKVQWRIDVSNDLELRGDVSDRQNTENSANENQGLPPRMVPAGELSIGQVADLRHRQNQVAKWSAENEGVAERWIRRSTPIFSV